MKNQIYAKGKQLFVMLQEPADAIRVGKPIKTALGSLHTVFSGKHTVGKMLDCPYLLGEARSEKHLRFKAYRVSTVCNQYIYVNEDICIFSADNFVFLGFMPEWPLDGDYNR